MSSSVSDSRVVDRTLQRRLPHMVASAWHRVLLATHDTEREQRALDALDAMLRCHVAYALADYLGGAPDERVEELWPRLARPSLGTWLELQRALVRALQRRPDGPFAPSLVSCWSTARGKPTRWQRQVEGMVALRNRIVHDGPVAEVAAKERSDGLVAGLRAVLSQGTCLTTFRPMRVVEQRPTRRGSRGKLQFLVGQAAQTEPVPAEWTAQLLPDVVYLVHPDGDRLLELSPFVEVRPHPVLGDRQSLLLHHVARGQVTVAAADGTLTDLQPEGLDGPEPFDRWLAARDERVPEQATTDGLGTLALTERGATGPLGERFEVLRELGRGGMSMVYEVTDRLRDEDVAVKVLHAEFRDDPEFRARFKREARALRGLTHPHLLTATELDELPDGRLFLRMPVLPGGTVRAALEEGKLDLARAQRWTRQLLSALATLHEHGVVHRDLKPSNLLIDGDDQVVLGDFGIALAVEDTRLTRTMQQLGSLAYLAPECRGRHTGAPAADLYAAALVVHELFTGELPGGVPGAGLDGPVGRVVRRLGQPDPAERGTAAAALRELSDGPVLTDEPPPIPGDPLAQEAFRQGWEAFLQADYGRARRHAVTVLERAPSGTAALFEMIVLGMRADHSTTPAAQPGLLVDPDHPHTRLALLVFPPYAPLTECMARFDERCRTRPDDLLARVQQCFFHHDIARARALAEALPRAPLVRDVLARQLRRRGRVHDAIDELHKGLELFPRSPGLLSSLALLYLNADRADDAVRQALDVLSHDPGNSMARRLLITAHVQRGDVSAAMGTLESASTDLPPDAQMLFRGHAAGVLLGVGAAGAAHLVLQPLRCCGVSKVEGAAWVQTARHRHAVGDLEGFRQALDALEALGDEWSSERLDLRARAALETGDVESATALAAEVGHGGFVPEALLVLQHGRIDDVVSGDLGRWVLRLAGMAATALGNRELAVRCFRTLVDRPMPIMGPARFARAQAHAMLAEAATDDDEREAHRQAALALVPLLDPSLPLAARLGVERTPRAAGPPHPERWLVRVGVAKGHDVVTERLVPAGQELSTAELWALAGEQADHDGPLSSVLSWTAEHAVLHWPAANAKIGDATTAWELRQAPGAERRPEGWQVPLRPGMRGHLVTPSFTVLLQVGRVSYEPVQVGDEP